MSSPAVSQPASSQDASISGGKDARLQNRQRLTPELVFAFVEPFCGGADEVIGKMTNMLCSPEYAYEANPVIMSGIISDLAAKEKKPELNPELAHLDNLSSYARRVNILQEMGNELRHKYGRDILVRHAMKEIAKPRAMAAGSEKHQKPLRYVHFIKSLKNEEEYRLLQEVYGPILFLVGVSDSEKRRIDSYKRKSGVTPLNAAKKEFEILAKIDQNEGLSYGQQVGKLFHQADLFLTVNEHLDKSLRRFLELLFGKAITSPTQDEIHMKQSYTASMRSCCLSRQVGAAIADPDGMPISTGWNDVPAAGGGLVMDSDGDPHNLLCKSRGGCNSNIYINDLLWALISSIESCCKINMDKARPQIEKKSAEILKHSGLGSIKEFSRAVHAEMEAILSAARKGRPIQGATMYVTTYPCENCVKHIIAGGIRRVVYIEPYPKSKAADFYHEQIHDLDSDGARENKVIFEQFTGIAPKAFTRLFGMAGERKDSATGKLLVPAHPPMPITHAYMDGYPIYEANIIAGLKAETHE